MMKKFLCGWVLQTRKPQWSNSSCEPTVVAFFIFRKCLISRDFNTLDSYNPLVHIDHQYPWDKTWTYNKRQSK